MRAVAILTIVVTLFGSVTALAQDATPQPRSLDSIALDDVERFWARKHVQGDVKSIQRLVAIAYSFESSAVASAVLADLPRSWFIDGLGKGMSNVKRMAAPTVSSDSQMYRGDMIFGDDGFADVHAMLFFRTDSYVVILDGASGTERLTEIDDASIGEAVVQIGQTIQGRTPSNESPHLEGEVAIGGLYDLLPNYQDLPIGMTLVAEFGDLPDQPTATPAV